MFYHLYMSLIKIYLNIKFKISVEGIENIPRKGGIIICSNHISNFDPLIICTSTKRKIHYFAKKELFDTKLRRICMNQLGAFPVDRDKTDMEALKNSIKLLKMGKVLGIFAQGTRSKNGENSEAKNGVSLFALKGNVPVVPIGITSIYEKGSPIKVNIGKPITFEKYKGQKIKSEILNAMTDEIMKEINSLL